jgi:hypothetical protein
MVQSSGLDQGVHHGNTLLILYLFRVGAFQYGFKGSLEEGVAPSASNIPKQGKSPYLNKYGFQKSVLPTKSRKRGDNCCALEDHVSEELASVNE